MKAFLLGISSLLSSYLHCATGTTNDTLSLHKAGGVTIDMTVNEVYGAVGKENTSLVDLYLEAMYSPALVVSKNGVRSVIYEIVCDKVWRVTVLDSKYKTQKGIGVESNFGDLKKNYTITSIEVGEGNVCAYVKELEMSFCLDYRKEISGDLKPEQVGKDVKIVKVFVL